MCMGTQLSRPHSNRNTAFHGEGPAIGIDLGTTYSCLGVWRNGRVEILENEQGRRITPSCVAFTGCERLVGDGAKNLIAANPTNTVYDAKRLIGRKFGESTVQSDMALWPFKVAPGKDEKPMIVVQFKGEEKRFTAEEISAMVLSKMKEIAETFLGREVSNAVVTVPAYFNDLQRRCTKDAGTIAGLNVMRIINEPTAAALAYGLHRRSGSEDSGRRTVVIFDLGGGTFDVSLLEMEDETIEVKATAGDTHLGGEDFSNRMASNLSEEFKRKHGRDISKNARARSRLVAACERAKRELSFSSVTTIHVECLDDGIDLHTSFTRAKFEDLNADLFEKCIAILEGCLRDAGINKKDVDDVVLVGGSTRIPKVKEMVGGFFRGMRLRGIPNPDEAVACGAAVQAGLLAGEPSLVHEIVLKDVTPISLGLRNAHGVFKVFIRKNEAIPTRITRYWTIGQDNLTRATFEVYEGERIMAADNNLIGTFTLTRITPAPAYVPVLEVIFHLDEDGILHVSAKDKASGNEVRTTITNDCGGRLGKVEMERMVADAKRYRLEDERRRRKAEARSELERFAYTTRNAVRKASAASRLEDSERARVELACARMIGWSEENATTAEEYEYREKKDELEELLNDIQFKLHL